MPIKRRTSKHRAHAITQAAIEAYQAGDYMALHRALGLQPWEISPLECEGPCPYTGNSAGAVTWPQAQALRKELEAAVLPGGL